MFVLTALLEILITICWVLILLEEVIQLARLTLHSNHSFIVIVKRILLEVILAFLDNIDAISVVDLVIVVNYRVARLSVSSE
jgi:hypothetical protein